MTMFTHCFAHQMKRNVRRADSLFVTTENQAYEFFCNFCLWLCEHLVLSCHRNLLKKCQYLVVRSTQNFFLSRNRSRREFTIETLISSEIWKSSADEVLACVIRLAVSKFKQICQTQKQIKLFEVWNIYSVPRHQIRDIQYSVAIALFYGLIYKCLLSN